MKNIATNAKPLLAVAANFIKQTPISLISLAAGLVVTVALFVCDNFSLKPTDLVVLVVAIVVAFAIVVAHRFPAFSPVLDAVAQEAPIIEAIVPAAKPLIDEAVKIVETTDAIPAAPVAPSAVTVLAPEAPAAPIAPFVPPVALSNNTPEAK